jgi:cell division protein FtsB
LRKQTARNPGKGNTKKPNPVFGFFYQYWITIILIVVLTTLVRQNFFINQFPTSLASKQDSIDQRIQTNQTLDKQNTVKQTELKAETASNMEVLESQARYRFGLIKKGEIYYQITPQNP